MLFTRDLRIADNETLRLAAQESNLICGVLSQDDSDWGASKRKHYQACIGNLAYSLDKLGHKLFIIDDPTVFDKIYCSKIYNTLEQLNISHPNIVWVDQFTLFKEHELPFSIAELPKTFTPFRHTMDKLEKHPVSPFTIKQLPSPSEFQAPAVRLQKEGGEIEALIRLSNYFQSAHPLSYFDTRNGLLNINDSTKFSPYLAWGCISPERVYFELKSYEQLHGSNKSTYWIFFELLWRDYFKFLSLQFGNKIIATTGTADRELPQLSKQHEIQYFSEWKEGRTEQPFINANMIELRQTGWMSNRGRQNAASFLTKTKGVSWLLGAQYFADHLIDYDVESNYGNWAYLAGVGVDPRDRLFNITRQAALYDPHNHYQDKWLNRD